MKRQHRDAAVVVSTRLRKSVVAEIDMLRESTGYTVAQVIASAICLLDAAAFASTEVAANQCNVVRQKFRAAGAAKRAEAKAQTLRAEERKHSLLTRPPIDG